MFYKLLDNNIDDTSFIAITEMYKNVTSSVRYKGLISESFPIQQGTRQGGKSSPLLYLLYINDLIKELESSRLGMCMYNVDLCSPTVADFMVLVSFSKSGLDKMLALCYKYAMKWRFEYTTVKCAVVICNSPDKGHSEHSFHMGQQQTEIVDQYTHLGITCDKYLSTHLLIQEACRRLRGTFLRICNNGIHPENLNPLTSRTIYKYVVIPKALYGCEMWSNLSNTDIAKLERARMFVLNISRD